MAHHGVDGLMAYGAVGGVVGGECATDDDRSGSPAAEQAFGDGAIFGGGAAAVVESHADATYTLHRYGGTGMGEVNVGERGAAYLAAAAPSSSRGEMSGGAAVLATARLAALPYANGAAASGGEGHGGEGSFASDRVSLTVGSPAPRRGCASASCALQILRCSGCSASSRKAIGALFIFIAVVFLGSVLILVNVPSGSAQVVPVVPSLRPTPSWGPSFEPSSSGVPSQGSSLGPSSSGAPSGGSSASSTGSASASETSIMSVSFTGSASLALSASGSPSPLLSLSPSPLWSPSAVVTVSPSNLPAGAYGVIVVKSLNINVLLQLLPSGYALQGYFGQPTSALVTILGGSAYFDPGCPGGTLVTCPVPAQASVAGLNGYLVGVTFKARSFVYPVVFAITGVSGDPVDASITYEAPASAVKGGDVRAKQAIAFLRSYGRDVERSSVVELG